MKPLFGTVIKIGDRILYRRFQSGELIGGTIRRIEPQVPCPGKGVPAEDFVGAFTISEGQGAFVDLEGGSWIYASQIARVVSRA